MKGHGPVTGVIALPSISDVVIAVRIIPGVVNSQSIIDSLNQYRVALVWKHVDVYETVAKENKGLMDITDSLRQSIYPFDYILDHFFVLGQVIKVLGNVHFVCADTGDQVIKLVTDSYSMALLTDTWFSELRRNLLLPLSFLLKSLDCN